MEKDGTIKMADQSAPSLCYKGWKLKDGNSSGRCCCNCQFQLPGIGHPWNKKEWMKRSPPYKIIAFVCAAPGMESATLFDNKHGMCEMHEWKKL